MFLRLFRDKFDLLLTTSLFVLVLLIYIQVADGPAAKVLEYVLNSLAAAFLALLGLRRYQGNQFQGDIDTANITTTGPAPNPPEDPEPGSYKVFSGIPKTEVASSDDV